MHWVRSLYFLMAGLSSIPLWVHEEKIHFPPMGEVTLFYNQPNSHQVVIFVSGDGGLNRRSRKMVGELLKMGALVIGVDFKQYAYGLSKVREKCLYPAAQFEALSKFVQKKLQYPAYLTPILVGYSSGATLVYAALAQAPPSTFQGAISLGFCDELSFPKPLCKGTGLGWQRGNKSGEYRLQPNPGMQAEWMVIQGKNDRLCAPGVAEEFVHRVPKAEIVLLPTVGHGFSDEKEWMPRLQEVFKRMRRMPEPQKEIRPSLQEEARQLPLVEIAVQNPSTDIPDAFAVILSGDGGWAGIDREIGDTFAKRGIPVVGLNSLNYFWTPRTPDGASSDLNWILRHYLRIWGKKRLFLIGYSLGADVLPFMYNRLPEDIKKTVAWIGLIGPSQKVTFEFHMSDWLGIQDGDSYRVLPEANKLRGKQVLCFYGAEEDDSLCPLFDPGIAETISMKGGHHLGGNYPAITEKMIQAATITPPANP